MLLFLPLHPLVQIKDTKAKKAIGATVVKLKELLVAEDMVMDQKFHIKTSEGDSYVNMRLALRVGNAECLDSGFEDNVKLCTSRGGTVTCVDVEVERRV